MPYLYYLNCESCGDHFSLELDYIGTIEAYIQDGRAQPQINQPTLIWDYLLYVCPNCKKQYKYTYRDVERRVREHFAVLSKKYEQYFSEVATYQETEESRRSGHFFSKVEPAIRKRIMGRYGAKD